MHETMYRTKVAVVTGAAGGIGQALVTELLEQGAVVWAWDLNQVALHKMAREAKKQGQELHVDVVDVSRRSHVEKGIFRILSRHPRIDYWFNNAAIAEPGEFRKQTPQQFRRVLEVNLNGVILGTRAALAHMEERGGGAIVNIASVAGHLASPFLTAYSATKHAVVGFSRALREELRLEQSPVRIVLVSPGFVDTAMVAGAQGLHFPDWLRFALCPPERVAREILQGVLRGRSEIFPTWNGRLMLRLQRLFPQTTLRGSKILLARSVKDLLLNRYGGVSGRGS